MPLRVARLILRRMALILAAWAVRLLAVYGLIGLVFCIAFLLRGVARMDPLARAGTRGFRMMIAPGVIALWPLLLRRWRSGRTAPPMECNAHRRKAAGDKSTQSARIVHVDPQRSPIRFSLHELRRGRFLNRHAAAPGRPRQASVRKLANIFATSGPLREIRSVRVTDGNQGTTARGDAQLFSSESA
ncbi:MAG: hypothetical protein O3B24_04930 [Verrucomicrobia bacterium]|nr:hypothetical protein [Verrucomicrobiota bacterium]